MVGDDPNGTSSIDWEDVHPTNRYAAEIVHGIRPSCRMEYLACERHLKDLQRQATADFPYVLMNRVPIVFLTGLKNAAGTCAARSASTHRTSTVPKVRPRCVFGWVHMDSGKRRFKKAFHMRARGVTLNPPR